MHLKNWPPIFVPAQFQREIESLSKAALMDLAWDFAARLSGTEQADAVMRELRAGADIVQHHRRQARMGDTPCPGRTPR